MENSSPQSCLVRAIFAKSPVASFTVFTFFGDADSVVIDRADPPGGPGAGMPVDGLVDPTIKRGSVTYEVTGPGFGSVIVTVEADRPLDDLLGSTTLRPSGGAGEVDGDPMPIVDATFDLEGRYHYQAVAQDVPGGRYTLRLY